MVILLVSLKYFIEDQYMYWIFLSISNTIKIKLMVRHMVYLSSGLLNT